jgi:glycine betaine/proline transport system substrate-binding protein
LIAALVGVLAATAPAWAADPPACATVRLADIGWVDVSATTALTGRILKDLGYTPQIVPASVPETYAGMKAKTLDVFMGNWMPSMADVRKPFVEDKSVEVLGANLTGAKFALAVPQYLAAKGLRDVADLPKFGKELGFKIYGLEPGNEGNRHIRDLIARKQDGFAAFQLVEEPERALLAQVRHAYRARRPIVFLGWAPHPMNRYYKLSYLTGGDDLFGPDFGAASVYTNVRAGFAAECPNVGRLLANEVFDLPGEDAMMAAILDRKMDPSRAASAWLRRNKAVLKTWLEGVTTLDGKPALPVVTKRL